MKSDDASVRTRFVDPIWVTATLWFFVLLGAATADLTPLSPVFLIFLLVGIGAHLGGMVVRRSIQTRCSRMLVAVVGGKQPHARTLTLRTLMRANRITWLLLAFEAAGMVYFFWAYSKVVPSLDTTGFLVARSLYLDEVLGLSDKLFLYTTHLTLFGMGILFFSARAYREATVLGARVSKTTVNLVAITTFVVSLMTTGRTAPLLVILSYSFYCLRFGLFTKKTFVVVFGVLSLGMFFVVAFALGKEGLGDSTQLGTGEAMINLGRLYFFSAPIAMQEVVMSNQVVSNACSNIFSYPVDLLRRLGMFAQCDARELQFVFIPVATNVFTFFRAYWEDFRWAYPAAMFVTGYLIETVHIGAFQKPEYCAYLYPFVLNALLLQIFEEQLFSNGSVFAYLTVIYIVFSFVYRLPLSRYTRCRATSRSVPRLPQHENDRNFLAGFIQ